MGKQTKRKGRNTMKNYFEYKGYIGTVEMSPEDEVFYGTIQGISDLVTFEADNFTELKEEFKTAVDDYIQFCEDCGKEPEKTYKGQFNVRVEPELHKALARQAIINRVSLNQIVETACKNYLSQKRHQHNKAK